MAPSFLNHRLLIDDYTTLLTTPSAVNAFNFTTPGWKSHPLYTGNFDDTVTEFNRNDSSNLEILVKFVGTSVTIGGSFFPWACPYTLGPTDILQYYVQIDDTPGSFLTRSPSLASSVIYQSQDPAAKLEQRQDVEELGQLPDKQHVLRLYDFSVIQPNPDPETVCTVGEDGDDTAGLDVDYALVGLTRRTNIKAGEDRLVSDAKDATVVYSPGDWESAERNMDCPLNVPCMQTRKNGATVDFTFFGDSITIFGHNPFSTDPNFFSSTITVTTSFDQPTTYDLPNSLAKSYVVYEASNLGESQAPHTISIKVDKFVGREDQKFQISGYVYSAPFATLGEAEDKLKAWVSSQVKGSE